MSQPVHRRNINNLIQPLLTDKYQVSMCYSYWCDKKHDEPAVFDLFFRKNPFKGEYTIFAGLAECLNYLDKFSFSQEDIDYLKTIPDYADVDEKFWLYLKNLDTRKMKFMAIKEGSVCFPNSPLVTVEGPLGLLQLIETTLLNLINYASLICTNAARYKQAVTSGPNSEIKLFEFGLRRSQGPDGGVSASRYSYIGGFDATSNLLAGKEFGIPVCGTLGHAYIMSYFGRSKNLSDSKSERDLKYLHNLITGKQENFTDCCLVIEKDFHHNIKSANTEQSEFEAFIAFACAFPKNFLVLVDTYDVLRSGLINFSIVAMALIKFGYRPMGVRIDSGDLAYLSRSAREMFETVARQYNLDIFNDLDIIASNDINEETINSLNDQNHAITGMGIGTHLVTCQSQPALGCVYKLVQVDKKPCMKLSSMPEKINIPCKKSIYRLYGSGGKALLDLIVKDGEPAPRAGHRILCRHPFMAEKRCYATPSRVEPLLIKWWDSGLVKQPDCLSECKKHCRESLSYFTEDIKRSLNPTPYMVSVSEDLFKLSNDLKVSLTPIGELS